MFSSTLPPFLCATGLILSLLQVHMTDAQPPGTISPIAQVCGPNSTSTIVCIQKYGAVMPYHFVRTPSNGTFEDTYASTLVPNDTSFGCKLTFQ